MFATTLLLIDKSAYMWWWGVYRCVFKCWHRLITLDNGTDRQKFRMMLKRSIHLLTPSERSNLPLSIREKMHRMVALIEEKQAL